MMTQSQPFFEPFPTMCPRDCAGDESQMSRYPSQIVNGNVVLEPGIHTLPDIKLAQTEHGIQSPHHEALQVVHEANFGFRNMIGTVSSPSGVSGGWS